MLKYKKRNGGSKNEEDGVERLSECMLLEENGWTQEDIKLMDFIVENDFEIEFKG